MCSEEGHVEVCAGQTSRLQPAFQLLSFFTYVDKM